MHCEILLFEKIKKHRKPYEVNDGFHNGFVFRKIDLSFNQIVTGRLPNHQQMIKVAKP
jgi:hypothetical protein